MHDQETFTRIDVQVPPYVADNLSLVADVTGVSKDSLVTRILNRWLDFVVIEETVERDALGTWRKTGECC